MIIEELRKAGATGEITLPTYDELVASGAITASECRLTSMDFVTPGWQTRAPGNRKDKPFSLIPGGKDTE